MAEVNESMRRLGLGGGGGKSNNQIFIDESKIYHSKPIENQNDTFWRYILGTADDDTEVEAWEAELEGELNEFEVVSSKDGNEDPTDDMTEDQIQEMLDAEDGTSSTDSLKRKWRPFLEKWLMLPMMP